jgi:DNA end-binding protein Ku
VAARPVWKGAIKLSLISIPVRVFPATDSRSDVSFRQLHRKCHTPIQLRKWCPHCEEEVGADDIVKGYESSKGRYVLVSEEDIAKVRPTSTHTIDLSHVLATSEIDPIYIERSYFLAPDNRNAGSPFAVLREALEGQAGVGRLALHGREYLVAVLAREAGLVMYTLRTAGEVRDMADIETLEFAGARTKPDEVRLARQVLQALDHETQLSAFTDHYEEALKAMLTARAGSGIETAEGAPGPAPRKVVNLMDALRQSLAAVSTPRKKPVRAKTARRTARVIAHPGRRARKAS